MPGGIRKSTNSAFFNNKRPPVSTAGVGNILRIGDTQASAEKSASLSVIEAKQQDIAVLYDIFLAFVARLAGLLGRRFTA